MWLARHMHSSPGRPHVAIMSSRNALSAEPYLGRVVGPELKESDSQAHVLMHSSRRSCQARSTIMHSLLWDVKLFDGFALQDLSSSRLRLLRIR